MSNQKLYTFIIDWNGGTYVSQLLGNNVDSTVTEWANNLDINLLVIQPQDKADFITDVKNENAIALDGITSVWVICPNIKDKMATINIIETVQKQSA